MIKIENVEVRGFEAAVRGCRNSWNSHEKSDSYRDMYMCNRNIEDLPFIIGENDHELLMRLIKGGDSHSKCMRMVTVWFDLTAPIFFWKHIDTYKHMVKCSESVMHTITARDLRLEDFTHSDIRTESMIGRTIQQLNDWVKCYKTGETREEKKLFWRCIVELLPQSYMQKATICTNYQALRNIYLQREGHRLSEWAEFRKWVKTLPYSELITGGTE